MPTYITKINDAQTIIFINEDGNELKPDGSIGDFICTPNDAQPIIFVDLNGNEDK